MLRVIVLCGALLVSTAAAWADAAADCTQLNDLDLTIRGCTQRIHENSRNKIAYYNRGNAYRAKGENDRAIADYNKAIEIDPKYTLAYNNRGYAYRAKGDNDRAIADYNKAIEIDPKSTKTYNNRGIAYGKKGDNDRAIADYNKAIELDPKYALAYNNRGIAYRDKGDNDRAIADYNKAIELDPKYALAYNNRGIAYGKKGDTDRAIADYNRVIEIDPKNAHAYNSRAWTYFKKGDYDRAIADASVSLTLEPQYANALDTRGRAYIGNRSFDRALTDFGLAITINPTHGVFFEGRGETYEALGDRVKAVEDYNVAVTLAAPDASSKTYQVEAARRLAALRTAPTATALAATAAPTIASLPITGRRIALLIGNQRYSDNVGPLRNPHSDVALLETALKKVGFEVTVLRDTDYRSMDLAIKRYISRVRDAGNGAVSFFYYSGHGAANPTTRINFLIPVDVADAETDDLWNQALQLSDITDKLSTQVPDATHYVVFDACRDELKLKQTSKSLASNRGFSPISNTSGMLVAYSTAPNKTASDVGIGSGPYAKALAEEITRPGQEAVMMFRNVQLKVKQATGQDPWLSFPTLPPVYFAGERLPQAATAEKQ